MSDPNIKNADSDLYIINPRTKRLVLKASIVGRQIVKKVARNDLVNHINKHASTEMIRMRDLMRSDLSDEKLASVLTKLIDLDITESVARAHLMPEKITPTPFKPKSTRIPGRKPGRPKKIRVPVPVDTPTRSHVQSPSPPAKLKLKRSVKKFTARPVPQTPATSDNETTDFQTTDCYSDSD